MLYTSLNEIKSFSPCTAGWKNILQGQNKREADHILFPLVDALESNSISDVCWLIEKRKKEIQICVKFAKMWADSIKHLSDSRPFVYAAYADARQKQQEINKQFLIQCIREYVA